ncbi:MAG: hypothetical protein WKF36_10400 [Candidatus Nitrosocosmicus sp.]
MNNNKRITKLSATNIKNAFMLSAIAFVLALGTGYSQMQSFGQGFDSLPGFDIASDLRQSADCAGMLNDCGNDKSRNNPPTTPPTENPPGEEDCEAAVACFVDRLNPTQLGDLKFVLGLPVNSPNELLCTTIDDLTAAELRAAITAPVVGVTDAVATAIINCLIDAGFTNLETA